MSDAPASPGAEKRLSRATAAVILLGCAFVLSQRMIEADLWGHIQYGEDWLAEGELPRVASHTYAAPDYLWVNHENLSELALAFGHRAVGGLGLMIGKAALGVVMLFSMVWLTNRRGANVVLAAMTMLCVSLGLAEFWCARPQLASFLSMAAVVLVLEWAFAHWEHDRSVRLSRLLALLPLVVIWTNAHGGFLAGVCVVAAYLGLRGLEILWVRRGEGTKTVAALGGIIVACGLCTLLNPYGTGLLQWLAKSLGEPRPEISEWVSIPNSGPTIIPFTLLTLLTLVSVKFTTRRRDVAQFVTIALVAVQTFMHCRHIAFFAILFGYWMPPHLQSVWNRLKSGVQNAPTPKPLSRSEARGMGIATAVACLVMVGMLTWQLGRFGVKRSEYPVDALQYMADNDLDGRVVVTFNWAQYTLAAMPNSTVGFDGRFRTCYPQNVVDMHFDLVIGNHPTMRYRGKDSGTFDATEVLRHGNPDFVLIDRVRDVPAARVMAQQTDNWCLLYQDQMSQLWGRADKYDDPASSAYIVNRDVTDSEVSGIAAWPGFPREAGRDAFVVSARTHLHSQLKPVRTAAISLTQVARFALRYGSPLPVVRLR